MFARGKDVLAWVDEDYLRAAFFSAQHYNSEGKGTDKIGDCENLRCWIFVVSS